MIRPHASPHTIFVEEGGKVNQEFAERLAAEMGKAVNRIPVGEFDSKLDQSIQLKEKSMNLWGYVVPLMDMSGLYYMMIN